MKFLQARLILTCIAVLGISGCNSKPTDPTSALTAAEATSIATDAYVFGYPLVTMEMTRRVMTNVGVRLH